MPHMFGKYELLKRIGAGGMAEVFLARQSGLRGFEKLLVIKRVLPMLAGSAVGEHFVDMFLDEARLAAQLNHPNIVQIYELGRVDDQFFIVMEYVPGVDLWALLKQGHKQGKSLPLSYAVKIVSYICEALGYAHDRRDAQGQRLSIVHRDVSPHNVLIAFDGGVKLTDFGIAKATTQAVKTQAGTLKGKLHYMSPEQISGLPVDHRSDLFSVGVLLYELVTGARPFSGNNEYELMEAIVRRAPVAPAQLRPGFPASLQPVLDRALAKSPLDRYPDAAAMQLVLEGFLIEQKTVVSAALLGEYARQAFGEVLPAPVPADRRSPSADLARAVGTIDIVVELGDSSPVPGSGSIPSADPAAVIEIPSGDQATAVCAPPSQELTARDLAVRTLTAPAPSPPPQLATARDASTWVRLRTGDQRLLGITLGAAAAFVFAVAALFALVPEGAEPAPRALDAPQPTADAATPAVARPANSGGRDASIALAAAAPDARRKPPTSAPVAPDARNPPRLDRGPRAAVVRPVPVEPARPAAPGALTIDSDPWAEVWLGGVKLGVTPLAYVKLPAGRHQLTLRNPEQRIETQVWVDIEASKTLVKRVKLR